MTLIIDADCQERFLPLHSEPGKRLREQGMLLAGLSQLRTGYEIARPDPTFHLLLYTLDGGGWIEQGDGRRQLAVNELLLVPAHVPCRYGLFDRDWRILWFHLADAGAWRALRGPAASVRAAAEVGPLRQCCEGLLAESAVADLASRRIATHYAELVVRLLEREVAVHGEPRSQAERQGLLDLWDRVTANPEQEWTVAALAGHLHCSPATLHRLCARHHGVRPMEMVTRLRMQRAAALLVQTDQPLKRIAALVGYRTPFSLSVAFKRYARTSPQEFRNRAR